MLTAMKILTDCRHNKFSMHVIVPGVLLDNNTLSCHYLSWEFSRILWRRTNKYCQHCLPTTQNDLQSDLKQSRTMLRLLMLNKQVHDKRWMDSNHTHQQIYLHKELAIQNVWDGKTRKIPIQCGVTT